MRTTVLMLTGGSQSKKYVKNSLNIVTIVQIMIIQSVRKSNTFQSNDPLCTKSCICLDDVLYSLRVYVRISPHLSLNKFFKAGKIIGIIILLKVL